jgi:lambda family phage portal protein
VNFEAKPNLVDRAVAFFDPSAGLARVESRTRLMATTAMFGGGQGGYRGGKGERAKRRGWFSRGRSANADVIPGSDRLRAEQRDAAMNQPIATAAINRKAIFTIGTGLMAIPSVNADFLKLTPDEKAAWEKRISDDYDAYMASKDVDAERKATGYGIYGVQGIVQRGADTSGDILALRVMPDNQPGRVISTAWKLVEADRLRNPPGTMDGAICAQTGNMIAGGVEVDAYGAPVAYWILKQHPGDLVQRPGFSPIPERIDAWDTALNLPRVLHIYKKERPEQLRGVGMLATVIELLGMIADLTDAELFAAVMSAMIAIVYKSPGAQPMPEPDYGEDDGNLGHDGGPPLHDQQPQYKMESGSIMEIDSDAEVDIKSPGRPNSAFDPFFQAIVRQIGAAIGIPAGVLMLLFNSSYTASKAELEAMYLYVRAERAWIGGDFCDPTYHCFVAEKVARGDYVMPGFFKDLAVRAAWLGVTWRGDGKITLNAAQEAAGYKIRQDNGWQTGEEITAELTGGSFSDNVRKRGAEHRAWLAEGLPVAVSPGTPAANVDPGADDGPPAKKKDQQDD